MKTGAIVGFDRINNHLPKDGSSWIEVWPDMTWKDIGFLLSLPKSAKLGNRLDLQEVNTLTRRKTPVRREAPILVRYDVWQEATNGLTVTGQHEPCL